MIKFLLKCIRYSVKTLLKQFGTGLDDKTFIRLQYFSVLGKFPNIDHPSLFTEKLQWLKLYDHNPLYIQIVDKYTVKDYIKEKIGEKYIIPTLGVWNAPEEIDFKLLPNQFVLKTTFGGGSDGVVICRNKKELDIAKVMSKLKESMKTNPYLRAREWPYKDVPHRIIAERYMEDDSGELRDYKFYCFNGEPKVMLVASNRFTNHNFNYFDMEFNKLPIISAMGNQNDEVMQKPDCFDEMKCVATELSKGFPHMRVDLYYCDNQVYFGELTLYDSSGYDDLSSPEWNERFGDWINLSEKTIKVESKKGFGNEAIDLFY